MSYTCRLIHTDLSRRSSTEADSGFCQIRVIITLGMGKKNKNICKQKAAVHSHRLTSQSSAMTAAVLKHRIREKPFFVYAVCTQKNKVQIEITTSTKSSILLIKMPV